MTLIKHYRGQDCGVIISGRCTIKRSLSRFRSQPCPVNKQRRYPEPIKADYREPRTSRLHAVACTVRHHCLLHIIVLSNSVNRNITVENSIIFKYGDIIGRYAYEYINTKLWFYCKFYTSVNVHD